MALDVGYILVSKRVLVAHNFQVVLQFSLFHDAIFFEYFLYIDHLLSQLAETCDDNLLLFI